MLRLLWRVFLAWYWAPTRRERHQRLLRDIAALERDLGMADTTRRDNVREHKCALTDVLLYDARPSPDEFSYEPGAVWLVDDPGEVQFLEANASMMCSLAARGALHSGLHHEAQVILQANELHRTLAAVTG